MSPQILQIVVASPNDVKVEREIIEEVAGELNRGISAVFDMRLEVMRWETDAFPGFHTKGPQALIDNRLRIERCDLLIGIFWKRIGTPVHGANSGTEHEFQIAYQSWKTTGRPQVMVYFNQKPYMPSSKEETDQQGKVFEFRILSQRRVYGGYIEESSNLRGRCATILPSSLCIVPHLKVQKQKLAR